MTSLLYLTLEDTAVELTVSENALLTRMRKVAAEDTGVGVLVSGKAQQKAADHLVALGLAHEVLHGDDIVFVAGQPDPSCGSLVPGSRRP